MMRISVLALAASILVVATASAQTIPLDPGPFPPVRYLEDHSDLADPAKRTGFFDPLKYIPLGSAPDVYLSLGGEIRERYEHYDNVNFGTRGPATEDYLLSRILLDADLHLGPHVRTFLQFGEHDAPGKPDPLAPVDADRFDVQQAFVDVSTATEFAQDVTVRAGRQEMLLGSGRFIDIREGPNVRQSHDGVRAFASFDDGLQIDVFLTRPTLIRRNSFDDGPDPHQVFGGVYATLPLDKAGRMNLDGYYYLLLTKDLPFVPGSPMDRRHTIGSRFWGRDGAWDYDTDVLFQAGSQGSKDIRAGGVAAKAGYMIGDLPWRPRFGVQADYFSGGDARDDRTTSTFNPLFPRGGYFSEPGLQTFENLIDVYPSVTLNPVDTLAIMVGLDFTWRASTHDFVYIAPGIPIAGTDQSSGSYIGTNYVIQASWTATPNLSLNGSYVYVDPGAAITRAHGKDINYAAFWASFKF